MFKAVLFDFDGVLVDSMPFHVQAWQSALGDYNIKIAPEDVLLNEGCRSIELAEKIFADWNYDISSAELARFLDTKQTRYQELTNAKLDDQARSFIARLRKREILVALVTGTSRANVNRVLDATEKNLFDVLITGDDVKRGKPDPESYLQAARALNVGPETCLVVENAPLGIQAAKNAGMQVVALSTTLHHRHLEGADFYFEDLRDLERNWWKL